MASIFTYDPDPPKVSSPWLGPEDSVKRNSKGDAATKNGQNAGLLSDYGVTKLAAEPQSGPTEYKLHLLLRPRRAYKSMTTTPMGLRANNIRASSGAIANPANVRVASTSQPRQQRLLHLTTQLLWRLQQSSPYHASSSKEIPLPQLPDDSIDLSSVKGPDDLVPGLEESRGALYEIGVSDDGTLVGLTMDEMDESIKTLRVMAISLGCSVEVLRKVIVGDCEWIESVENRDNIDDSVPAEVTRATRLWVAEALVKPNLGLRHRNGYRGESAGRTTAMEDQDAKTKPPLPSKGSSRTPQLRVTFTGPTTSGKSSLLGTLSTGTLDNGRGKSRLSLLKHRHEVVSGVTSSIAQELIGYKDGDIVNFSQRNIESWVDIHDCAEDGRLVFVSDSGGHPRYRRTVLRGLMNWAPHWSVLCIAADDVETGRRSPGATSTAQDVLGMAAASVDLIGAHLALSLRLNVPMAVVVTKLDLASKVSLQKTMSKILSAIKESGRVPKIVQPDQKQHLDIPKISSGDSEKARIICQSIEEAENLTHIVPIVLTSSVKGTGIGLVHALLEQLPMPPQPTAGDYIGSALNPEQPQCLFHIDDTFSLPDSFRVIAGNTTPRFDYGVVVSGYLRFGTLSTGDKIVVGPFPPEDDDSRGLVPEDKASPGNYGLSISHPSSAELAKIALKNAVSASSIPGEWDQAIIVSIRNLRLPVRSLEAGQAGTIGLAFGPKDTEPDRNVPVPPRIRRGMVLAIPTKHMEDTGLSLQAASGITAIFNDPGMELLAVGSFVNIYVASVKAAARVRGKTHHYQNAKSGTGATEDIDDVFDLNEEMETEGPTRPPGQQFSTEVFLELMHNREWVEMGSPVILLEGGAQDISGLEGYVGKIIEIVD